MAWFHRDERATAMGIKQTGVPAGGFFTALLAPPLVLLIGWRGAFAALGVLIFYSLLFSLRCGASRPINMTAPSTPTLAYEQRQPLDVWGFLPASCGTAIFLIGQMSLITYLPLYLKESMGFTPYWASQALAIAQGGAMVGTDRLGCRQRPTVRRPAQDRADHRSALVSVVLITGLESDGPNSPLLSALLAIVFLAGLCIVGYQGVSYASIGELAGTTRTGAAMGLMITINAAQRRWAHRFSVTSSTAAEPIRAGLAVARRHDPCGLRGHDNLPQGSATDNLE